MNLQTLGRLVGIILAVACGSLLLAALEGPPSGEIGSLAARSGCHDGSSVPSSWAHDQALAVLAVGGGHQRLGTGTVPLRHVGSCRSACPCPARASSHPIRIADSGAGVIGGVSIPLLC